jgi:hypothetical protein
MMTLALLLQLVFMMQLTQRMIFGTTHDIDLLTPQHMDRQLTTSTTAPQNISRAN